MKAMTGPIDEVVNILDRFKSLAQQNPTDENIKSYK